LLPLHVANGFKETVTKAFNLGAAQENTLLNAILEAYKSKGIIEDDETTWDNPSPTFKDVYEAYMSTNPKIDSLTSALQKIYSFKIFEEDVSKTKSLFDLIDGITVIDIHEVSPDIQNLIVAITLDLFYTQMQCAGHSSIKDNYRELTKFVLVDEADNFLQYGFPSIKKILKEGREFGVGTILSTQFLSHFDNGDDGYSKYINTWIIHKVPDISAKDIKGIFSLPKNKEESTISSIKTLSKHCSITNVNSDNNLVEMRDKPFFELYEEIKH
jgi:DNA phosphorothioation-dependent restriction protein DptH